MNEELKYPPSAPTSRITWILLILGSLGVIAFFGYPFLATRCYGPSHILLDTSHLKQALYSYKENVGEYPQGDNRAISKALLGENPAGLQFFDPPRDTISPEGDLLDPWGTPYRFYFSDTPLIRSAGKNKKFENNSAKGSDDYFRG